MGWRRKVGFCANLGDVRLDLNHLKGGSGKWLFFLGILDGFWVLVGSPGVMGGDPPLGVEDGVG